MIEEEEEEEFHIGQIWLDRDQRSPGRELVVERVSDGRFSSGRLGAPVYIYLRSCEGRATRIAACRLRPPYYQLVSPPGRYVLVPSESNPQREPYKVWTGDPGSPPHCPCENFRHAQREPHVQYLCKHLKLALGRGGMS